MVLALPLTLWGQDLFGHYWANTLLGLSPTVLFLWMFLSSLLCLLLGNGILKGRNWARTLTLAYCVAATLIAAAIDRTYPLYWLNLVGNLAFIVLMWFFLYRPQATAFFNGEEFQAG